MLTQTQLASAVGAAKKATVDVRARVLAGAKKSLPSLQKVRKRLEAVG